MLDDARADLDQALADRCELSAGERAALRNRGAHAMHQPERGDVKAPRHQCWRGMLTTAPENPAEDEAAGDVTSQAASGSAVMRCATARPSTARGEASSRLGKL